MKGLRLEVLRFLRIFGPLSNFEVARKLRVRPGQTYRVLYQLWSEGLVVHPGRCRWDVSQLGRDFFARMLPRELTLFEGGS